MPRDADTPIRLGLEHTRYPHWGGRSGYPAFAAHLDPTAFETRLHAAPDNHHEVAGWLRPLQPMLKRMVQRRRMKWYKVCDLEAELRCLAQSLGGRRDLIHFLDGEHGGQFLPRLLRSLGSKVRTVATFHQPAELLEDILDPGILRHLDHIILMSPSQRPFFEAHAPAERVSVILHGVDTDFFHPAAPAGRTERGRALRCVTVGHWLRDWSVFRQVAAQSPGVEFHAVTGGDTGADHLANVHRRTGLSDEALAELYRSADILFLPLLDSTANNALLEGMASGLPVVTTDLEAVRAYLPADQALLAPVGDVASALAAVQRLGADPDLRRTLGAAARRRAENLSLSQVAGRHAALYARLLGRRLQAREAPVSIPRPDETRLTTPG